MADGSINVDTKVNADTAKKQSKEASGALGGLEKVVKSLGKSISSAFSWKNLVDFGKESLTAAGAANVYATQIADLNTAFLGLQTTFGNALIPALGEALPCVDTVIQALTKLAEVVDKIQPGVIWLWDNFFEPIVEWTGGVVISVLEGLIDVLDNVADWCSKNEPVVRAMAIAVGVFAAAWAAVELGKFVINAGGVASMLKSLTKSINNATLAKLKDNAETVKLVAMYAKDFAVSLAKNIVNLAKEAAAWITSTAAKIANTVAQVAMTAATAAWNVVCTVASAVTTAFGAAVAFLTSPIGIVLLAIGALIAIVVLLVTHWEEIKAAALACWDKIVEVWGVVSQWFSENVIAPIVDFFTGLWETISNAAGLAWETVCGVWTAVSEWFDLNVIQPLTTFFSGLWEGISGAASSVWDAICGVWAAVSEWFDTNVIQPVSTFFSDLWDGISSAASSVWDTICGVWETVSEWFDLNVVQPVATFFSGLWEDISNAASGAWDGIKETFQAVAAWFDEHVISPVRTGFKDFINGLIRGVESFINFFIRGINSIISGINSIGFKLPDVLGGAQVGFHIPQISEVALPRLAAGAVIPPNREFMAVLGDQRHGNNIEAPERLLRQIAREEAGSCEIVAELREILAAVREGKVMMVGEQTLARVVSRAMTSQSRARGAAVIPV